MLIITEKIKNILENKGLSQYKLAKLIGYDHGALGYMIRGERPFPKDKIQKIAPILEVSPETIKGWGLADKYPKNTLKKALKIKQEHTKEDELPFIVKINNLMKEKNLNVNAFATAIGYNQGLLSQVRLGNKPVSGKLMHKVYRFSGIPEDEIESWIIADKYSLDAIQVAIGSGGCTNG